MRYLAVAALTLVMACDEPTIRHFPSGRPCSSDQLCLGTKGNECNYVTCDPGTSELVATAVACMASLVPPVVGGPFDCDPRHLGARGPVPPSPCPLGSLWTIDPDPANGPWGQCVPLDQCQPIACDPSFGNDGCPGAYRCDLGSHVCIP